MNRVKLFILLVFIVAAFAVYLKPFGSDAGSTGKLAAWLQASHIEHPPKPPTP